jgi:hypothetical protein
VKKDAATIPWLVLTELAKATEQFGSFGNAHEGYAVLLEEVDELWEVIKSKPSAYRNALEDDRLRTAHGGGAYDLIRLRQEKQQMEALRNEAVQVAAMAMRFLMDVCDLPDPTECRAYLEGVLR